jgi:hypothetical protein
MGEANRRRQRGPSGGHMTRVDSAEVRALLAAGEPINVNLFGAAAIHREVCWRTFDDLMAPERHAFRLAFQVFDRMRTGEIEPWQCTLCGGEHAGLRRLSVMAVIERTRGEPTPEKPGLVAPICQACDGISTAETTRRLHSMFGLSGLAEGSA